MERKFNKISVLLLAIILISSFGVNVLATEEVIKIGAVGPLTGPAAESGISVKQGMELAILECNENGGIKIDGEMRKVKAFYEDCQSKPEVGVSVAEKLITRDKVNFLLGDMIHSSVTLAIMELAPKYNIPIASVESTSPEISKKVKDNPDRYAMFWKGSFDSTAYGAAVFNTYKDLIDKGYIIPKSNTVTFVVEDSDYGRGNAEICEALFDEIGWETIALETVSISCTDFYSQLYKLKSINPDIVVSCFTALSSGVAFVKQFQEVGLKSNHMAIYYPVKSEFFDQVGEAGEGLLWTPLFFDPETIEKQQPFVEKIKKHYNVKATSDQLQGYEVMLIVLDAIQKSGSLEPEKITVAMGQTDREGMLGHWVFDKDTHSIKDGGAYIPVPACQTIGGKNYLVWPSDKDPIPYEAQSWTK